MNGEISDVIQSLESPDQTSNVNRDIDALKQDLKQLRQDVTSLSNSLKKIAQGGAELGRARAQNELERLYEKFKETYDIVRQETGRARNSLEKEIGDRPLTAMLGALAVGLVLGRSMSAR
jgi:ElaB/YqjD/DUF883 family membrane-anchored ribosome-binding protein